MCFLVLHTERSMKQHRVPQRQKAKTVRIQELRRSNAAQPIPSGTDYKRKPKHGLDYDLDDDDDENPYLWS